MDRTIRNELDNLLKEAGDLKVQDGEGFEDLPEGDYLAAIQDMVIKESKSGNLMLEWEFVIDAKESFGGRHHWKYAMLTDAKNVKRAVTELEKFGLNCSSIAQIEEGFTQLLDKKVVITIKHSKLANGNTFVNTSVNPV